MHDFPRLIEHAFPLQQTSLDAVHEKNVRHGHISTLHIWPARRPLAACRAALLATLLPDPGTPEGRQALCERIGGVLGKTRDAEGREKMATTGGVLRWLGTEPTGSGKADKAKRDTIKVQRDELEALKAEIRKVWGRAPKVHDPFSGGGAIPLEAMRLGCESFAADLNPVSCFILRCTLEYPQKFAGKKAPLPAFALRDEAFMAEYLEKVQGLSKAHAAKAALEIQRKPEWKKKPNQQATLGFAAPEEKADYSADLAWQVRAWGRKVLADARVQLAKFYPTYADFQPIVVGRVSYEPKPAKLCPLLPDGTVDAAQLNGEFDEKYLENPENPRWVAKPTVAYLWARSVQCKKCRAQVPLLKTRWLCKKDNKRVVLTMEPAADGKGVVFGIDAGVPVEGRTAALKKAFDAKAGAGTMSRTGASCPCCGAMHTMEDLRAEGKAGRLGQMATAVVVDGASGKEYRTVYEEEALAAENAFSELKRVGEKIPFGMPNEPLPPEGTLGFRMNLYGFNTWDTLFSPRQLLALGSFVTATRQATTEAKVELGEEWGAAIGAYLALSVDKQADYSSSICSWHNKGEKLGHTFARFALPMVWDFTEVNPSSEASGGFPGCLEWVALFASAALVAGTNTARPTVRQFSAIDPKPEKYDVILTDPPYYDAIPYSDLMDFFYIWLRRTTHGLSPEVDKLFLSPLAPKWNDEAQNGELIDDSSRHGGDKCKSKNTYEDGMARTFQSCHAALEDHGRLVIVFAHKHPDAWETLVTAIIRAGFVVDSSWPIATEMATRTRAANSAALSSSVWLVCKKRPESARPGWDAQVLAAMRKRVGECLHAYWDAGIRGPDFVWAATGPAMEAYSAHPVVRLADGNGVLPVHEFLIEVRRMVVDFVVGRVLYGDGEAGGRLDELTSYYLLHRNDFGLDEAPIGSVILYGTACGVSDTDLAGKWDLIKGGGPSSAADAEDEDESAEDEDGEAEASGSSGGKVKLKTWNQRKAKHLGLDAPGGAPVPMIDRIHRLMRLWSEGDLAGVDDYLDANALRKHELFKRLLQSLIELAPKGDQERSLLESLSNHLGGKGALRVKDAELFKEDK